MDNAVALVQAYLQVNGYFTVAEYQVLEAEGRGPARTVTDLDILAFRFAGASHTTVDGSHITPLSSGAHSVDPLLGCSEGAPDMIVGEVKEGPARFNGATRDPAVLEVALARFGCCSTWDASSLVRTLLRDGYVVAPGGHVVRLVAFGATTETAMWRWKAVSMRHIVEYLRSYLRTHWDVLRHAQIRDPALGVLALIEKWGAGHPIGQSDGLHHSSV